MTRYSIAVLLSRLGLPVQKLLPFKAALLGIVLVWSGQGILHGQEAARSPLPPGNGRELVMTACSQCHGVDAVLLLRDGRQGWKNRVEDMVLRGAQLLPDEATTMIDYLAENFGVNSRPRSAAAAAQSADSQSSGSSTQAVSLPPGPGQELVQARCSLCHDLQRVISIHRSRPEWERVADDMVARGVTLSDEEMESIVSYLSTAFGK